MDINIQSIRTRAYVNPLEVHHAYENLKQAAEEAFKVGELAIIARDKLDQERAKALLDGSLTGKNEQERDARARELFAEQHQALAQAESADRWQRYLLEQARIEVERTRALLRLSEIVSGR